MGHSTSVEVLCSSVSAASAVNTEHSATEENDFHAPSSSSSLTTKQQTLTSSPSAQRQVLDDEISEDQTVADSERPDDGILTRATAENTGRQTSSSSSSSLSTTTTSTTTTTTSATATTTASKNLLQSSDLATQVLELGKAEVGSDDSRHPVTSTNVLGVCPTTSQNVENSNESSRQSQPSITFAWKKLSKQDENRLNETLECGSLNPKTSVATEPAQDGSVCAGERSKKTEGRTSETKRSLVAETRRSLLDSLQTRHSTETKADDALEVSSTGLVRERLKVSEACIFVGTHPPSECRYNPVVYV